jgi:hypothetical protein
VPREVEGGGKGGRPRAAPPPRRIGAPWFAIEPKEVPVGTADFPPTPICRSSIILTRGSRSSGRGKEREDELRDPSSASTTTTTTPTPTPTANGSPACLSDVGFRARWRSPPSSRNEGRRRRRRRPCGGDPRSWTDARALLSARCAAEQRPSLSDRAPCGPPVRRRRRRQRERSEAKRRLFGSLLAPPAASEGRRPGPSASVFDQTRL